ncbi:hypothetical protein FKM82_023821 [Ascaphus truei]
MLGDTSWLIQIMGHIYQAVLLNETPSRAPDILQFIHLDRLEGSTSTMPGQDGPYGVTLLRTFGPEFLICNTLKCVPALLPFSYIFTEVLCSRFWIGVAHQLTLPTFPRAVFT